jgi:hypothetical protein
MKTINSLYGLSLGSRSHGTGRATLFSITSGPSGLRRRGSLVLREAVPLWFAIFSPLIGLGVGFLGAWVFTWLTS